MSKEIAPILSIYEGDPVYQPLLDDYVAKLPERLLDVCKSFRSQDIPEVKRQLHRFKGSAATYGFPQIANLFKNMEDTITASHTASPHEVISSLTTAFEHAVNVCALITTFSNSDERRQNFQPNDRILKINTASC